jgi:integrase
MITTHCYCSYFVTQYPCDRFSHVSSGYPTPAEVTAGPLFRKVNRGGAVESARLSADGVRQILLKRAAAAGLKGTLAEPVSPHGLRAGFVTTAYRNGVPDEEIMGHTRHRSLTTMRSYVRRAKLSQASPAGKLGL